MTIDEIDMNISCTPIPTEKYKKLFVDIRNSPKKLGVLNRAFTEALGNIRFCETLDVLTEYKGKTGFYALVALINYPFDFPNELFKRNFMRSVNNSLMKTVTFDLPTADKANCLMRRLKVTFESMNLQFKNMFVTNTRLTVQYECQREKHLHYSKTLCTLFEKIKKSTDWVIDRGYNPKDAMAIESLIKLTGFTGKYTVETRFAINNATITLESMEEADEFIDLYRELKEDYIYGGVDGMGGSMNRSFFVWDTTRDLSPFLEKYNGVVHRSVNGVRWIITDYKWLVEYSNGVPSNRPHPFYTFMNSIFLGVSAHLNTAQGYFKYFWYHLTSDDDIEKLLYFLPKTNIRKPYIYHTSDGKFLSSEFYVETQDELERSVERYHREKNSVSVLTATSLNNNFETRMIEKSIRQKFKSCPIKFYPYKWIEGDLMVEYVAIIGACGQATLRRVNKIIEANYEAYKKKFLSTVEDKDEVEIFSQDSLQDIEAYKFPYLCCLESQYYDIKELGKYIESTNDPVLPHSRRPLTEEDFQKIASVACDGVDLEI